MRFYSNWFLKVCILLLIKCCQVTNGRECVIRRLGACKVMNLTSKNYYFSSEKIPVKEFSIIIPEGFQLKTKMEINLLANKNSFTKDIPIEEERPVYYDLNNAALVHITIYGKSGSFFRIQLGYNYYRQATFYDDYTKTEIINNYTPILPSFPYILDFQITTNGTFSVYADIHTEPFFRHQLSNDFQAESLHFETPYGSPNQGLVAFYDCSIENKPNCGIRYVDKLYDCREWYIGHKLYGDGEGPRSLKTFQETYETDILFDEYIVVEGDNVEVDLYTTNLDYIEMGKRNSDSIGVANRIEVKLGLTTYKDDEYWVVKKSVRTEKWVDLPANTYAVRVVVSNGTYNNYVNISNIRGDQILSMNLCGTILELQNFDVWGKESRGYFDCLIRPGEMFENRTRKSDAEEEDDEYVSSNGFTFHEKGYNFTKSVFNIRDYVGEDEPLFLYNYDFGLSKKDWCDGDPYPELYGPSERSNTAVHSTNQDKSITDSGIKPLLIELQNISAQIRAIASNVKISNEVILTELRKINSRHATTSNNELYNAANEITTGKESVPHNSNNIVL